LPIKLPINFPALNITRRYYLETIMLLTSTNATQQCWMDSPKPFLGGIHSALAARWFYGSMVS